MAGGAGTSVPPVELVPPLELDELLDEDDELELPVLVLAGDLVRSAHLPGVRFQPSQLVDRMRAATAGAWDVHGTLALPGNDTVDMASTYQKLMEEVVEPRLSRVEGVAQVRLEGGRPSEVQIRFDPHRLAAQGLTPQQLAQAVAGARRHVRVRSPPPRHQSARPVLEHTPTAVRWRRYA